MQSMSSQSRLWSLIRFAFLAGVVLLMSVPVPETRAAALRSSAGHPTGRQHKVSVEAGSPGTQVVLTVLEETVTVTNDGRFSTLVTISAEVLNEGPVTVAFPRVEIALFSENDRLLGTREVQILAHNPEGAPLLSERDIIPPGEVGVFSAGFFIPAGEEVADIHFKARAVEWEADPDDPPLALVGEWQIEATTYGVEISGVVRNSGSSDLVGVAATVIVRDTDGRVVGATRVFPRGERIGGFLGGVRAGGQIHVMAQMGAGAEIVHNGEVETLLAARPRGNHDSIAFRYGVAGVAHRQGAGGSSWQSALNLTNRSGASATVFLAYRHEGGRADAEVNIEDGSSVLWNDVVRALFGVTASAAGYVQIQSDVPLDVTARTVNQSRGGGYGQALPVFTQADTFDLQPGLPGILSPLRGGGFRTNIGLVNMSDCECWADVRLFHPDGSPLSDFGAVLLQPTEWIQINRVLSPGVASAYASVEPAPGCHIWAYASVIDESTGDPTIVDLSPGIEYSLDRSPRGGPLVGCLWADIRGR